MMPINTMCNGVCYVTTSTRECMCIRACTLTGSSIQSENPMIE